MSENQSFATLGDVLGKKKFCPDCHTLMQNISNLEKWEIDIPTSVAQWICPQCEEIPLF